MKMLAFLTAGNVAFFPAKSPELAAPTLLALAAGWLLWPIVELIEGAVE